MRLAKEHYRGCLLGGAVGDALGWPVEFLNLREIQEHFGEAGINTMQINEHGVAEITDDTQMTLFTAEGILRACSKSREKGICNPPAAVYRSYLRWFDTQYGPGAVDSFYLNSWLHKVPELHVMRGPGHTCLSALRSGNMGTVNNPITNSKGCGGVMRMAPIGLSDFGKKFRLGCECALITHGHPSGYIPAGMLAQIIEYIIFHGSDLDQAIDAAINEGIWYKGNEETTDAINKARHLAQSDITPLDAIRQLGEGWVGEEALAIAIYCSLKFQSDFKQAVITAVNHDGDSDSTGAITGNILGAYLGINAIPKEWLAVLELKDVIVELADDLFERYEDSCLWHEKYPGY